MWNRSCRICSAHFLDSDIFLTKQGRCKIHETAIPKFQPHEDGSGTAAFTSGNPDQMLMFPDSPGSSVSVSSSIFDSPVKADLKEKVKKLTSENEELKTKVKNLNQKVKRLEKKNSTLQSKLQLMKEKYEFLG